MARKPPLEDTYWPLGGLSYASEVHDFFPDEAELIGSITILWNRQELALKRLFVDVLRANKTAFAEAIWDRQPTHQARRDMLALALDTAGLSKRQRGILTWVIDNTKTLADRRNELIHAEYVVHGRTDALHARVKAPRSQKPPKHQKVSAKDLERIEADIEHLLQATEAASLELVHKGEREKIRRLSQELKSLAQSRQNQQTD